jgi:RNA polymerase sigma-70 factor (ECF subfamily)
MTRAEGIAGDVRPGMRMVVFEVGDTRTPRVIVPEAHTISSYGTLFAEEAAGVWRTLYVFTGGRRDVAEEATAEAFARAMANTRRIREPLAWIYRTAFRLAKEELQRERRHPPPEPDVGVELPALAGELISALRRLSPNQRAAIVMRYEVDLTVDEIASRMGLRPSTVRVHLFRGRTRLRELLGTEEIADD